MVITVSCPACATSFPVDTNKIPLGGVNARCSSCGGIFRVERPAEPPPPPEPVFEEAEAPGGGPGMGTVAEPQGEAPGPDAAPEPEPAATWTEPAVADEAFPELDEPAEMESLPEIEPPADSAELSEVETLPEIEPLAEAEFPVTDEPALPAVEPAEDWVFEREGEPGSFRVEPAPEPAPEPPAAAPPEAAPSAPPAGGFTFGRRDPTDKARRLARVLVSDMIMYNPDRHRRALANGTLKEDFEEEIAKSWKEYVDQVGEEMATGNTFWTEALNDVLAKGERIF